MTKDLKATHPMETRENNCLDGTVESAEAARPKVTAWGAYGVIKPQD